MSRPRAGYQFRAAVALAAAGLLLGSLTLLRDAPEPFAVPETVAIPAGEVALRPLGNFSIGGKTATPPVVRLQVPQFEIMKHQVSRTDYAVCVEDKACAPVPTPDGPLPQTQVSWRDATRYAEWFSARTGQHWRLPSEAQWQRAAADQYHPDTEPPPAEDPKLDPGARMLAQYAAGKTQRKSQALQLVGAQSENAYGVADMVDNVWEWTNGCFANGVIQTDGGVARSDDYCGVRIAAGVHRAAVIDFVRDASGGGCAIGLPPDHLGFRLVWLQ